MLNWDLAGGRYKVKKCGDIFEKLSPHPQKTLKVDIRVAVKLAKTLLNSAQIVPTVLEQNDFAHTFAKSVICYTARSRLGNKTALICGSKLDFSTREKNHQWQLVDTICAKSLAKAL